MASQMASHLRRAESGAKQKRIGEGSQASQIEQRDQRRGFLALRGLDGAAQFRTKFGAKGLLAHWGRYRACLIMYSSTRGGTSPCTVGRGPAGGARRWRKRGSPRCPAGEPSYRAGQSSANHVNPCAAYLNAPCAESARSSGGITCRSASVRNPGRLATMKSQRPSSVW